jgi:ABC-type transport system involved in multi-copper enzyme maturation permease subunit
MTVLPIVERELRVAARQPVTYRTRLALPGVATAMFLMFHFTSRGMSQQMIGQQLFYVGFGLLFMSCLMAGCQLTADTISSEKREGTLGFLFLTDLKGYDIVLGKVVSSSVGAIYAVLGLLPLVSIMFLFGGVTGGAMLRLTLSSVNILFLSLAVGITCSCLSRDTNRARGAAMISILGVIGIGPLIGLLYSYAQGFPSAHRSLAYWGPFAASSPVMSFPAGIDMVYQRSPALYWITNAVAHGLAWGFLFLAMWLAPRTWQDKVVTGQQFQLREWWRKIIHGTSQTMAAYRARLLDINAVHWLTSRDRTRNLMVWLLLLSMVIIWFIMWQVIGGTWLRLESVLFCGILTNSIFKAWVGLESAKRFAADRESGALELLLCTTMPVEEIVKGQLLSVRKQFLVPFVVISLVDILLLVPAYIQQPQRMDWQVFVMVGGGLIVLWADFFTLPWMGMWKGMSAKVPKNAGTEAVGVVLGLPWMFVHLTVSFLSFGSWYFFRQRFNSEELVFCLWLVMSLGLDGWWIRNTRKRLYAEFRTIAMTRYAPAEPLTVWGWLGRGMGNLVAYSKRIGR